MSRHSDLQRRPPALVIFDSDGVLVDSEDIALATLAAAARAEGADIAFAEAIRIFRGVRMADCVREIERRAGRPMPADFVDGVRQATAHAFERDLRPVDGIGEALAEIRVPVCVGSNGPMSKIMHTLGLTGLLPRFEGRIFSAYELGVWKPDPGLFLHAALCMGAAPADCVVVEDSITGIAAARAAGMRPLGYGGAGPDAAAALRRAGAEVFVRMRDLPEMLAA